MTPTEDSARGAVERALQEDSPSGDVTTSSVVPETARCRAELRAKAEGVLAGTGTAQAASEIVAAEDRLGAAEVLCTRKSTPGLRSLEREAVAAGGGSLHRASLSDAVLIKDNHLRVAGS